MRRPVVTGVSQIALMALAPQHNDSAPDLHIRVMVIIPRRSEWWRSATQTAGPCVSLPLNRQLQTSCLVGLGRSPVSTTGLDQYWRRDLCRSRAVHGLGRPR